VGAWRSVTALCSDLSTAAQVRTNSAHGSASRSPAVACTMTVASKPSAAALLWSSGTANNRAGIFQDQKRFEISELIHHLFTNWLKVRVELVLEDLVSPAGPARLESARKQFQAPLVLGQFKRFSQRILLLHLYVIQVHEFTANEGLLRMETRRRGHHQSMHHGLILFPVPLTPPADQERLKGRSMVLTKRNHRLTTFRHYKQ
jgi:hypothetical protein